MKKSTALMTGASLAGALVLAGCGSRADEEPVAAPATETPAAAATETAAPAATAPEVEPNGTVIEVQMLTRDPDGSGMQVFKPNLIQAKVGDTIRFVPTDPTHQSSSIDGMLPSGANGWKGEINKAVDYVVPAAGVYGFECIPHYSAGMVGLLLVEGDGMLDNLEAAKAKTHPGLAGKKFEEIFAQAESQGMLSR